jgi:uncharacterized membrane protein
MFGIKRPGLTALLVAALTFSATPCAAHKKEHHNEVAPAAVSQTETAKGVPSAAEAEPAGRNHAGMMEERAEDRSSMSRTERLLDWLGRLHPVIIHFPLAFFPAALFTAIVGKRRPAFAKPVQFLVVAGGIIAPVAMLLGWFNGGLTLADTDPLLRVHRWLGTAIGFAGLGLAVWAWKRPEEDRRPGMVWGLAAVTTAIIVQGWYGGAMVHGADHMNW